MFCPRCRDEYRSGFTWCHDCDVALVDRVPDEPSETASEEGDESNPVDVLEAAPAQSREGAIRVLELGLVLFVGFAYSLVTSLHHQWLGATHGFDVSGHDPTWVGLRDLAQGVPVICVLLYVLSRRGRGLREIGVTARWSDLPLGLALYALLPLVGVILLFLPSSRPFLAAATFGWHARLSTQVLAPLYLAGLLCAAAKEELLVRAYMMSEVLDLTGSAFLAVASSTCLQALYHLYQGRVLAFVQALTFLTYSLFYWKTRRATPVVLAHFTHNLLLALAPSVP
jgi:membrane protease YdiL (CAAX protease family)